MKEFDKYEWGDGVFTLLSWFKKDKVKNARVLVAGAGALGNEVINPRFEAAGVFEDGIAPVKMGGKWGFVDKTGKNVIPYKYEEAYSFSLGLSRVQLYGKWGFIDKTGTTVIRL